MSRREHVLHSARLRQGKGGKRRRRTGAALLLTLLALVLLTWAAGRWMLRSTTVRVATSAVTWGTEAHWIAEGVARQWAQQAADPAVVWDPLLTPCTWAWGPVQVAIYPSSAQNKLHVAWVPARQWLAPPEGVTWNADPDQALLVSGQTALEVILGPEQLGGQAAYLAPPGQTAPGDWLTCWGSGKVDVNRAAREILSRRLEGFTDAQISGILRLRSPAPLTSLAPLGEQVSLTGHQQEVLEQVGTLQPETLEVVIVLQRGGLRSVYHAVVEGTPPQGRVLELRLVP